MFKKKIKNLKIRHINIFLRVLRKLAYFILDCFGYLVFLPFLLTSKRKKFSKGDIKKILIIRLDRIGDVLLSTPAIRAIRFAFLRCQLHVLVSDYTKDLLINNPHIDRLLVYKKDKLSRDYSLAIALHPGLRQNYLTFISGARFRIGYTGWGGGFFLTHRLKDDRIKRIRHEVESALEAVGMAGGVIQDKHLDISVTQEGERFAVNFFSEYGLQDKDLIVAIHPGARQVYIRWKKEGFAQVAERLIREDNAKVILIGSKEEEALIKEVVSLMKEKPILAVGLKLTEVVSLIKRCNLFIGNSSGPMHIAAALGVPVVAIFGSIHPLDSYKEWGPWGTSQVIVSKDLNCRHCHPSDCKTFDCMRLISSEDVLEAAQKLIYVKNG